MSPQNLYDLISESSEWLKGNGIDRVDVGVVLGSGLGPVVEKFNKITSVSYKDVPHLAGTAVQSHKGELILAEVNNKRVLIFQGRIHYYEGYEMWQVAYPVRLIKALGGSRLITTGATGGLNPDFQEGDLVLIEDHISLMPESPLRGPHDNRLGDRFPDMSEPYSKEFRDLILSVAVKSNVGVRTGTYSGLPGPSLETKAEYEYLHRIGADLIGMSIIPEVIVGVQSGMQIAGICVVSNMCYPPEIVKETTINSVVATVNSSASSLGTLLHAVVSHI